MGYYTLAGSYHLPELGGAAVYYGLAFNPDGTVMYVMENASTSKVYSFSLSTPWQISSASLLSSGTSVATRMNFCFRPNGAHIYYSTNDVYVYYYSLPTPWSIATETYAGNKVLTNAVQGIAISGIGTKMYVSTQGAIRQYSLSAAWTMGTVAYQGQITSALTNFTRRGMWWSADGLQLWVGGVADEGVYVVKYELLTPWELLTAIEVIDSVITTQADISGLAFNADMSKIYLLSSPFDIYEYNYSLIPPPPPEFWTNFVGQSEIIV